MRWRPAAGVDTKKSQGARAPAEVRSGEQNSGLDNVSQFIQLQVKLCILGLGGVEPPRSLAFMDGNMEQPQVFNILLYVLKQSLCFPAFPGDRPVQEREPWTRTSEQVLGSGRPGSKWVCMFQSGRLAFDGLRWSNFWDLFRTFQGCPVRGSPFS